MQHTKGLCLGYPGCVCEAARFNPVFPLRYYEVVADGEIVYSGYSGSNAWWAFVAAGKGGARRIIRFVDGVGMTFSSAV